jgi:hypothetical protein
MANESSFGRRTRVRKPEALRKNFHQAVVEIYALKQAGKDLDISTQANRGIYDAPKWIKDVKLQQNGEGDIVLAFPKGRSLEGLLEEMQRVPDYTPPVPEETEADLLAEDEFQAPEAAQPPPTMDPATPEFKKAALVKDDEDKPKFDFMSNRPVPRTPKPAAPAAPATPVEPVAEVIEEVIEVTPEAVVKEVVVEEVVATPSPAPTPKLDSTPASTPTTTSTTPSLKWQSIPLTDINIKFAVSPSLSHPPIHIF